MRYFSVTDGRTDGRTDKAILGVGCGKSGGRPIIAAKELRTAVAGSDMSQQKMPQQALLVKTSIVHKNVFFFGKNL